MKNQPWAPDHFFLIHKLVVEMHTSLDSQGLGFDTEVVGKVGALGPWLYQRFSLIKLQ